MRQKALTTIFIVLTGCYVGTSLRSPMANASQTVLYPGTSVYYVEGDTIYYYGGVWYMFENGEWYSARTSNGPWEKIAPSNVPSDVLDVHTMRFPPPPVIIDTTPSLVIYPGTRVYYWPDGHLYKFGAFWYLYIDGIWYRSVSFAGPWIVIRVKDIPKPVIRVYRRRPRVVVQPRIIVDTRTRVEYLPNSHIYRYKGKWYYYRNGRWYVGKTWRGPWRIVRRRPPEIILRTHRHRTSLPQRRIVPPRRVNPPRRITPPRREVLPEQRREKERRKKH